MLPKSAVQVFTQKPDCLSEPEQGNNVARECSTAPLGDEKWGKRYPRVLHKSPCGCQIAFQKRIRVIMLPISTRQHPWETKSGENVTRECGCTLENQKRPEVLPKGAGASLRCMTPLSDALTMTQKRRQFVVAASGEQSYLFFILSLDKLLVFYATDVGTYGLIKGGKTVP